MLQWSIHQGDVVCRFLADVAKSTAKLVVVALSLGKMDYGTMRLVFLRLPPRPISVEMLNTSRCTHESNPFNDIRQSSPNVFIACKIQTEKPKIRHIMFIMLHTI